MLTFADGDVLASGCEAFANPVNCVGAMGRGLARAVRDAWPSLYESYRADCGIGTGCDGRPDPSVGPGTQQRAPSCIAGGSACPVHRVRPGTVLVRDVPPGSAFRAVLEVPTKRHWKSDARLDDVAAGILAMRAAIDAEGLASVAVPALGCGLGGLPWDEVRRLLEAAMEGCAADVTAYRPA